MSFFTENGGNEKVKRAKMASNMIVSLFLDVESNLLLKKARLAFLRPDMLNLELFKKCDITCQK